MSVAIQFGASTERDEQAARVELAAAYRLAAVYGWSNLIYNHIALRVPGEPDWFFFKPHELMFE